MRPRDLILDALGVACLLSAPFWGGLILTGLGF